MATSEVGVPTRLSGPLLAALAEDVRVRGYAAAPSEVLSLIVEVQAARPLLEELQGQVLELGRRLERAAEYLRWCIDNPPIKAATVSQPSRKDQK